MIISIKIPTNYNLWVIYHIIFLGGRKNFLSAQIILLIYHVLLNKGRTFKYVKYWKRMQKNKV